jgi:hypothetical protein
MKKLILLTFASGLALTTMAQQPKATTPMPAKSAAVTTAATPAATPAAQVAPAAAPAAPVDNANNPNAAELKFVTDQHDFGTVPEGPQAKFDFEFTNEGKEPLILQNVQASCGCTTPEWPKNPILPGQKAKVTAIYNTQGRPGAFTKTITVTSNAKTPSKVITIRGTVEAAPATTAPEKAPNMISTPTPDKH